MVKTLDPAIVSSLRDAVRELEGNSCAEVVVEIHARSGSYAHADGRFAALLAFAGLVFLLFSPLTVRPAWVGVDVESPCVGSCLRLTHDLRSLRSQQPSRSQQLD